MRSLSQMIAKIKVFWTLSPELFASLNAHYDDESFSVVLAHSACIKHKPVFSTAEHEQTASGRPR